jgi:polyketide synthase 12
VCSSDLPKADAGWHLHELTRDLDLDAFVLFSSGAATFGSGGQGSYAAGNAFLDALACCRAAAGLPGVSLAWGLWAGASGMTGHLSEAERARISGGATSLAAAEGLALLDLAMSRDEPLLIPARLDIARLRVQAARGVVLPALWQGLAGPLVRPAATAAGADAGGAWSARLAGLGAAERDRALTGLVAAHAAAVLGHAAPDAIEPGRAFSDLGFDSLTAVELRNRLHAATGLRLPATLVFDYPTPAALAARLATELIGSTDRPDTPAVVTAAADEPVAIVAMSCRFPGGVRDPEGFWELLAAGRDAISGFPADRGWDTADRYDPDLASQETLYARAGGFVQDAAGFDPGFFGISPREALAMDPQQRLLLETSWEALERAAINPSTLRGSATGVFIGAGYSGYGVGLPEELAGHLMTGTTASVMSGRVSYTLGLEGPAVTVDTACSSSLVALHLACQALRAGECTLALVGGVTIMATPVAFAEFSRQRGLAADGRCKPFAAAADGTGWAEGAGMLLVERLSEARRLGHRVLAVVRGSAVNQDGASNGLTAPNGPSQQRVIRAALASARLSADQVDAVEAHGTGTVLGDPIEAQALLAAYGHNRSEDRPLWLGSVKSNIGHTQAAAGMAGVMKMVLALQHDMLPSTLHVDEPSPHVDWSAGAVRLLTGAVPWPANGRPRRAGVSSFGISGTNAHTILEEAPAGYPAESRPGKGEGGAAGGESALPMRTPGVVPWVVSGRTAGGLAAQAGRLAEFVTARPGLDPVDVGWSLAATRSAFEHRAVVTGAGREELMAGLAAVAAGQPGRGVLTGVVPAGGPGRVGFVFAGQGAQRAGMGRELHAASPVFAAAFDEACALLEVQLGVPVADVVLGRGGPDIPGELEDGTDRADQTVFAQAGLFAMQAGLVALLAASGITPSAVAGHSVGEIAAAYTAGMLSLADACSLVAGRARLMQALPPGGVMASVAASETEVLAVLADLPGVTIAAVNGPASVVISGDAAAVDGAVQVLGEQGRRVRRLRVSHAFHSALMDPVLEGLQEIAAGLAYAPPQVPWACALTGELADGCEPEYWVRHAREPVRFADAIATLAGQGVSVFMEIGPDGTLSALGPDALPATGGGKGAVFIPVQRPGQPGPAAVTVALAEAHVRGIGVNWAALLGGGQRVDLPTYAFQHQHYWPQPAAMPVSRMVALGPGTRGHPLLGAAVELAGGAGFLLTGRLSMQEQPWLADHAVAGTVLLPGTAFVELAVRAGDQAGCGRIEELTLQAPLILAGEDAVHLQVMMGGPDEHGRRPVDVYSRPEGGSTDIPWTRHASGSLVPVTPARAAPAEDFTVWPPQGAAPVPVDGLYPDLAAAGYRYGPVFQSLRAAWRRGDDIYAEIRLPDDAAISAAAFGLHPALLDAALHAAGLAGDSARPGAAPGEVRLPFAWTGVTLHVAGASVLRTRLRQDASGGMSLAAADDTGAPVVTVDSLVSRPVLAAQLATGRRPQDALFAVEWVPVTVPATADGAAVHRWAVTGGDPLGVMAGLAAAGAKATAHANLAALAQAVEAGEPVPDVVLASTGAAGGTTAADGAAVADGAGDVAAAARAATGAALELIQEWLAADRLGSARLVLMTRAAVAAGPGEGVADLAGAAVWGLARSAQSENPGRLVLADLPSVASDGIGSLVAALSSGEPELAIREAKVFARRLARPVPGLLVPPEGGPWRLDVTEPGTVDALALVACPAAAAPLEPGQVQVAARVAGMNFRDVLIALGMYPGAAVMGGEIAGVVMRTGPGVAGLATGDRVMGLVSGGFGPVAVTDARLLVPVPAGWSFAQAASVPVAFTTAWYALVDLAEAQAGQRLLVHAAAGGVGMAAVAIARHLGLEVYGTASPGKQDVLAAMGLDAAHVASSRTAEFEGQFLAATGGAGMDIVLNALAGDLTDASLRLLARGGAFIEMGKTDIRDPAHITRDHPSVAYRAFELGEAGPGRLGEILAHVVSLLAAGGLGLPPVRAWDVRRAPEAFRFMSQARHTGKIVLTIPPDPAAPRNAGTVLVTGGTGTLGGLVARHLAVTGKAAHLVLASRSGPAAPGVAALAAAVAASGAGVQVAVCDAADRAAVAGVLAQVPEASPLTGVVHTAGVLDDGIIGSLTPARVDTVMRPKADTAWILHELTGELDLETFVLFSSAAATFGGAGQGNYAAGNAFLDGLASHRRAAGLPATSLAWGLWADASGMTGQLSQDDRNRISRGMNALTAEDGLALLDLATGRDEALLVPALLQIGAIRASGLSGAVPALFNGLLGAPARPASAAAAGSSDVAQTLRGRLALADEAEQERLLTDLVRGEAAMVLGHPSPDAIQAEAAFLELGLDSLTAVEFRNRLAAVTGVRLPGTAAFDYPTPAILARLLQTELSATGLLTGTNSPPPHEGKIQDERRYTASADAMPAHDAASARFLGALYEQAVHAGKAGEMMRLIKGLAAFRPAFASPADLGNIPRPVPICRGSAAPSLICLPSFAGRSGEYVRLAREFGGVREVSVVRAPGFTEGEPLPATVEALISVHADNIRRTVNGVPFALAGHSSGGLVAHALATHLESIGLAPAAVVLIDTPPVGTPEMLEKFWSMLPGIVLADQEQRADATDDAWLTAIAHYFSLDWTGLTQTTIPTLLVRAKEPIDGSPEDGEWKTSWTLSSRVTVVDVLGDHFSMMKDHADTTARAVNEWLRGL